MATKAHLRRKMYCTMIPFSKNEDCAELITQRMDFNIFFYHASQPYPCIAVGSRLQQILYYKI